MTSLVTPHISPDPSFASDNVAGVAPEVLDALSVEQSGAAIPYGGDAATERLREWARTEFGSQAEIYPVFNGTGANVISLQALLPRWGAVICTTQAHITTDEGAAPERVGALKLLARPGTGKLTPADIHAEASAQGFVHAAQPLAVSLTQSTEVGSVYSIEELTALSTTAHEAGMGVHIDGARLANAAAALGTSLGALTTDVGADVVSLGATKNGALGAEAVVVINPERTPGIEFIRKYSMQLASKQRFLSAQLNALFGTDLWHRHAEAANGSAADLAQRLEKVDGVTIAEAPQVNAVFPEVTHEVAARITSRYIAHTWSTSARGLPVLRLMCSFQTTTEDIDRLVEIAGG